MNWCSSKKTEVGLLVSIKSTWLNRCSIHSTPPGLTNVPSGWSERSAVCEFEPTGGVNPEGSWNTADAECIWGNLLKTINKSRKSVNLWLQHKCSKPAGGMLGKTHLVYRGEMVRYSVLFLFMSGMPFWIPVVVCANDFEHCLVLIAQILIPLVH